MTIHVTQDDIDKGWAKDCSRCPLALAIFRATKRDWLVGDRTVSLTDRYAYDTRVVPLPTGAQCFVLWFDHELPVEPFSFDLALEAS